MSESGKELEKQLYELLDKMPRENLINVVLQKDIIIKEKNIERKKGIKQELHQKVLSLLENF